jgi:hypothetical protein
MKEERHMAAGSYKRYIQILKAPVPDARQRYWGRRK